MFAIAHCFNKGIGSLSSHELALACGGEPYTGVACKVVSALFYIYWNEKDMFGHICCDTVITLCKKISNELSSMFENEI